MSLIVINLLSTKPTVSILITISLTLPIPPLVFHPSDAQEVLKLENLKLEMNSKILQDKVQEIEEEALEMRLLKRNDKDGLDYRDRSIISTSQSTVSLKHYDQVKVC